MTETASAQEVGGRRDCICAATRAIAAMGLIWRETGPDLIGVDGEIGFVDRDGGATGRRVLVRAGPPTRAGPDRPGQAAPDDCAQRYWSLHPLPLVHVSVDPAGGACRWLETRYAACPGKSDDQPPRSAQLLVPAAIPALLKLPSPTNDVWLDDLTEVLGRLVERSGGRHFPVSHFDLFVHGLTDIARSLYFGTDLALFVAEENLAGNQASVELRAGPQEHAFLFDFVRFLVAQNLADVDYPVRLVDWIEHGRQAQFVAPLTRRGRELVRLIQSLELKLVSASALADSGYPQVAQEAFFSISAQSFGPRLARIRLFQMALQRRRPG